MDLKEAGQISGRVEDHWYYRAKLAAVEASCLGLHPSTILDVGSGSGFFARALLRHDGIRSAICVDPGYERDSEDTVDGKPLMFRRSVDRVTADMVLMMDVVEHVADDVGLIRDYVDRAKVGTTFLLTVPAFLWLWSGHDDYLGHHRRYTLRGLERAVRQAGLTVDLGCYIYGALLPLVAATRLSQRAFSGRQRPAASQMRDHGPALNALFGTICRFEAPFASRNRLGGVTALVRASKAA